MNNPFEEIFKRLENIEKMIAPVMGAQPEERQDGKEPVLVKISVASSARSRFPAKRRARLNSFGKACAIAYSSGAADRSILQNVPPKAVKRSGPA